MSTYKIAVLVGSLRKDSLNRKLALALSNIAPADFVFEQVRIDDLPLYNQDHDTDPAMQVTRLKAEIASAHGLLFVTPEYNRSFSSALKNAIDHASRPYGKGVWAGKPAGLVGVSSGPLGTALAQQHLRNVLTYLDVHTLSQPETFVQNREGLFGSDGVIGIDSVRQSLQVWMDRYVAWVKKHTA